jgi:hypothetical protein
MDMYIDAVIPTWRDKRSDGGLLHARGYIYITLRVDICAYVRSCKKKCLTGGTREGSENGKRA